MADYSVQPNVGYAAVIGAIVVSGLQIAQANGINIPQSVIAALPPAIVALVAWAHDVLSSRKPPSP
jgi:hypothetical protein